MQPSSLLSKIPLLHNESIVQWKTDIVSYEQNHPFLKLVEENHGFNYQLWHAEDRARRDDCGYEFVYHAKREIDYCNQQRNNRMEAMDEWLFIALQPPMHTQCPVHSETPGMMIDRLSIMALKIYHMALQSTREDVDATHRQNCTIKLNTLHEQQKQLITGLCDLLNEVENKTRTFRVYHQFKMYNDPSLNPELYLTKEK